MSKAFKLKAADIKPFVIGIGACLATDMITVEGKPVLYMYRETPEDEVDSGWRFMSGYETPEYLDIQEHSGIYDVNTIANYDPSIIRHLNAEIGASFERESDLEPFVRVEE
ncbi:DUF2185 domain-containing protein [Vibrio sonorensis]|uniref:DUF2185 domain-containing protein n=1 Tax=Vibrio sonorensis TaxID=1004316 RepID=UPI0008D9FF3B|nr:DUF2185 domain-containing protein [Vibrio sonorensis]